jgi:hypothetical protein
MERIQHFFGKVVVPAPDYTVREIVLPDPEPEVVAEEPKKPLTEFEKIYAQFNPRTDMIVLSYNKCLELSKDELNWLDSLGSRVYYFDTPYPVNMAILRSY